MTHKRKKPGRWHGRASKKYSSVTNTTTHTIEPKAFQREKIFAARFRLSLAHARLVLELNDGRTP